MAGSTQTAVAPEVVDPVVAHEEGLEIALVTPGFSGIGDEAALVFASEPAAESPLGEVIEIVGDIESLRRRLAEGFKQAPFAGEGKSISAGIPGLKITKEKGLVIHHRPQVWPIEAGDAEYFGHRIAAGDFVIAGIVRFLADVGVGVPDAERGDREFAGGEFGMLHRVFAMGKLPHHLGAENDGDLRQRIDGMEHNAREHRALSDKIVKHAIGGQTLFGFFSGGGGEIHPHVAFQIGRGEMAAKAAGRRPRRSGAGGRC